MFLSLLPHWDEFCSYRDKLAFNAAEGDLLAPFVNDRKNEVKQMRRRKQKQFDEKRDKVIKIIIILETKKKVKNHRILMTNKIFLGVDD